MIWTQSAAARRVLHRSGRRARRRLFCLEPLETRLALAAPVAGDDSYATFDGATLNAAAPGILVDDSDADGDPITDVVLVDNVDNGTLTLRSDGSFDYTPSGGFVGVDSFTYKIRSQGTTSLNVIQSLSNVTVNATLRAPAPAGEDSDSDSSSVTGTMGIRLGSPTQPFGTAQVNAANLVLADAVNFHFELGCSVFGCLATIDSNSTPGAMVVTMVQPGAAAPVDGANSFSQLANTLHLNGTADISCDGLGCGFVAIPPNPQIFDSDFATELNGQLALGGTTLTLTVPLSFTGTFDLGGGAFLDISMSGQVVATGTITSFEESNVATVTIDSRPRISASDDAYQAAEDRTLSVPAVGAVREDLIIPVVSHWRYLDDGSNQGTAWRDAAFVETAAWKSGYAELGYGDGDEETLVDCDPVAADGCAETPTNSNDNFITTYFRHSFNLERVDDIYELAIRLKRDDGAAVYVNGVEVARDNLATGAAFDTPAAVSIPGEDEAVFFPFTAPASMLVAGTNVIAVEVHQSGAASTDLSFDLELKARRAVRGVLANDANNVGVGLFAGLLKRPQNGDVTLSADGSFVYTPNADFTGNDSFSYLAGESPQPVLVERGAVWRYLDNGSNPGGGWTAVGYSDAGWTPGRGEFGYGDGDESTVVNCDPNPGNGCAETPTNANDNFITTYFRHSFTVADVSQLTTDLVLNVIRDDGVAVYLNGVEIDRDNLSPAAIFSTPADIAIADAAESTPISFTVSRTLLQNGVNVLAAEVHQQSAGSSDVSFDAWLTTQPVSPPAVVQIQVVREDDPALAADDGPYDAQVGQPLVVAAPGVLANDLDLESTPLSAVIATPPANGTLSLTPSGGFTYTPSAGGPDQFTYRAFHRTTLVPLGAYWRYLDDGTDQGIVWRQGGFDDAAWAVGKAELGYGDGDEATVVRYGPSTSNKFVTTYFRKSFEVANPSAYSNLKVRLRRDDGAALYLNGVEFARTTNLAADATFNTLAASSVEDTVEFDVPAGLLVAGANVLAVEMHQNAGDSTDISFDLELTADLLSAPATVALNSSSSLLPAVQGVLVRGTNWTGEFLIHLDNVGLGTGGYRISAGAAQSAPLPWNNVNQLVVVFSEPVVNLPLALALNGEATGLIMFNNLTTAPRPDGSFAATWTVADGDPLPDDTVTLTLPDTITNASGVPLDGNWTNNGDNYPSGDGTAGGSFSFRFVVLPGDVNQDEVVNRADLADDVIHGFQRSNSGTFSALHDVNGSAIVNMIDAVLIRDHLGDQAASPAVPSPAIDAASAIGQASIQYVNFERGGGAPTEVYVNPGMPQTALRATASRHVQRGTDSENTTSIARHTMRASRATSRVSAAVDRALLDLSGSH